MLYLGYSDEGAAFPDVLRLIVSTSLRDGTVEAIAGWGADAVVLLPGAYGGCLTVRIASVMGDPADGGSTRARNAPQSKSPKRATSKQRVKKLAPYMSGGLSI